MNIPVLLQAKADILAHPDQCQMGDFYSQYLDIGESDDGWGHGLEAGGCGTAACIAGWIMFRVAGCATLADADSMIWGGEPLDKHAMRHAGLTEDERHALFFTSGWPQDLKHKLWKSTTPEQFAGVMAERIDRLIEEGRPA